MPTANVNGIDIYYELSGGGEPLVLIGGLGSNVLADRPIIRRLSKSFTVLAFDNRGAGRSDKPDAPYSIEAMAEDTAALIGAAGIGRAHVVGISMGGRIAMALCLQHPGLVKSLALVSTFARPPANAPLPERRFKPERIPVIGGIAGKFVQPEYAFQRQLRASRGYDCSGRLNGIAVPTLILHGTRDTLAPISLAEEMHAGIRGSKMIVFDAGHAFFTRQNKQFCSTIIEFTQSIKNA